jgi:anti-anti-sigma regulatory factor
VEIVVDRTNGEVPVTIMSLQGDLDGSTYKQLIDKGKEVVEGGARRILVDMSAVPFMSSAGLVALISVAKLTLGQDAVEAGTDWNDYYPAARDTEGQAQQNVKLLGVQSHVQEVLSRTGVSTFFEIHADRETAVGSF